MGAGRAYDEERDLDALTRMWREVGWIDRDDDDDVVGLQEFLAAAPTSVADVRGDAECAVSRSTGSIRHEDTDLPLCIVAAVTTSHVGRRQGLASGLVAETLAAGVQEGAAVAALGMFDQGFYDRFGFGTSGYAHRWTFDPATLKVPVPEDPPVRLSIDDADEMHALLVRRGRGHGSVVVDPVDALRAELRWMDDLFALGFRADDGRLTSFVAGSAKDEFGPYEIEWMAYEDAGALLDLIGLLRALGDQVGCVIINAEPVEIQLQDLLETPMRARRAFRRAGGSEVAHEAFAEQQIRILDLRACVEAVRLRTPTVVFGLRLTDPLADIAGTPWSGVGGEYTVRFGPESTLIDGFEPGLPILDASINAFSRLWMGERPASSLALTDLLDGPAGLLGDLDRSLRLPRSFAGWVF